ncbi:MAG TPA: hypothetical protein VFW30_03850 [Bryocella sp.]|nr:hypothetical protein [Bryocella sp.]
MASFASLRYDSNYLGVEFLLTELDAAFTFLDVARATSSAETRQRNQGHALEAYDTIRRLRHKVIMEPREQEIFQKKLTLLQSRLRDLGYNPD